MIFAEKPSERDVFLRPFIDEAKDVISNGFEINGRNVSVRIRCFVCDTPARSYMRGTHILIYICRFISLHSALTTKTIFKFIFEIQQVYTDTLV